MPLRSISAILLLLFCASLYAATARDVFDLDLDELMMVPVETAGRTAEPRWKSSAVIYLVSAHDIRVRGYRHLGEVLRDIAGINMHGNSSGIFYNRFALRGISGNNKFIILYNGVRLGGAAGETLAIADNYPVQQLTRIEIMLSPASSLYGADALAGVVQLFGDDKQDEMSVALGDQGRQHLSLQTKRRAGWQLVFDISQDDQRDLLADYNFTLDDALDLNGQTQLPAAARHDYEARTQSRFVQIDYHDKDWRAGFLQQTFRHPSTAGDKPELVDYRGFWAYHAEQFYGEKLLHNAAGDEWQLRAQHQRFELDTASSFINVFTQYEHGYKYAWSQASSVDLLSKQLLENGYWQWGLHWQHSDAIPKTTDLPAPFDRHRGRDRQGFYPNTDNNIALPIFYRRDHEVSMLLARSIDLDDDISLNIGAQYSHSSAYGNTTNPRLHLNKVLANNARLGFLFGRAYLAPSAQFSYELFGTFNGQQDGQGRYISDFMQIPNADLKPERAQLIELNYLRLLALGEWQLSLYSSRLQRMILPAVMSAADHDYLALGFIAVTSQNVNAGEVRVFGAEFSYRYRWWPGLEGWFSYAYSEGELDDGEQQFEIPYTAQQTLKLGVSWRLSDRVLLTPSLMAGSHNHAIYNGEQKIVAGYAVANLFARYELTAQQAIECRVDNLFNAHWYNVGDATTSTFIASPQTLRRVELNYRYRF